MTRPTGCYHALNRAAEEAAKIIQKSKDRQARSKLPRWLRALLDSNPDEEDAVWWFRRAMADAHTAMTIRYAQIMERRLYLAIPKPKSAFYSETANARAVNEDKKPTAAATTATPKAPPAKGAKGASAIKSAFSALNSWIFMPGDFPNPGYPFGALGLRRPKEYEP